MEPVICSLARGLGMAVGIIATLFARMAEGGSKRHRLSFLRSEYGKFVRDVLPTKRRVMGRKHKEKK